jgi:mycothiol system anti-sigma-R factor
MNCNESFELLYRYIDHDCDGITIQEIEIHLRGCRPCWGRFEFEKLLLARVKESCRKETCTEKLKQRIQAILENY